MSGGLLDVYTGCSLSTRLGGRHPTVRRGTGLVPQNLRGRNHKSQRSPPQPAGKHPHQVCHAETGGGRLTAVTGDASRVKRCVTFKPLGSFSFDFFMDVGPAS